jgi:hypothetical protein
VKAKLGSALLATTMLVSPASEAANACVRAADKAQDLRSEGKLGAARKELLSCAQKSCNAVVRADCERWLREVDDQTPTVLVQARDTRGRDVVGARVTVDDVEIDWLGGTPTALDPGTHVVRATARSGATAEQTTVLTLGDKARVVRLRFATALDEDGSRVATTAPAAPAAPAPLVLAKEPARPLPVAPLILGGVGAAALGAFGYFEIEGQSAYAGLENGCGRTHTCTDAQTSEVRGQFVGAGVALGVAVVALGTAAVLYFTSRTAHPTTTALRANGFVF